MKVWVIGRGLLGSDLVSELAARGHVVTAPSRRDFDITNPVSVARITALGDSERPDWLVNCAAYTKVDQAESDRDAAFELNAYAPGLLAQACALGGFDCSTSAPTSFSTGRRTSLTSKRTQPVPYACTAIRSCKGSTRCFLLRLMPSSYERHGSSVPTAPAFPRAFSAPGPLEKLSELWPTRSARRRTRDIFPHRLKS